MPTELYEGESHHSTDRSRSKGPCITNNTRFRPGGSGYEILRRRCSQSSADTNVRLGWLISKRSIQVTWARPSNYLTSPVHTTSYFEQRLLKMTIQAFYVPTHRDSFIVRLSPREFASHPVSPKVCLRLWNSITRLSTTSSHSVLER